MTAPRRRRFRVLVVAVVAVAALAAAWPPFEFGEPVTKEYPPDPPFRDPSLPGVTVQRIEVSQTVEPQWPFFAMLGTEILIGLLWFGWSRRKNQLGPPE